MVFNLMSRTVLQAESDGIDVNPVQPSVPSPVPEPVPSPVPVLSPVPVPSPVPVIPRSPIMVSQATRHFKSSEAETDPVLLLHLSCILAM